MSENPPPEDGGLIKGFSIDEVFVFDSGSGGNRQLEIFESTVARLHKNLPQVCE